MCFGNGSQNVDVIFNGIKQPNSLIIDNDLKFEPRIRNMCKKAAQKLEVLNRISSFLDPVKKLVFNADIKSHFSYCLLTWINSIHERSLRTVCYDTGSIFQELL